MATILLFSACGIQFPVLLSVSVHTSSDMRAQTHVSAFPLLITLLVVHVYLCVCIF